MASSEGRGRGGPIGPCGARWQGLAACRSLNERGGEVGQRVDCAEKGMEIGAAILTLADL